MVENNSLRNFCILAHIDHGKSTLADRFLEITGTIERRKMREQFLDQMDLEREKGITIKMQPVRMIYHPDRGNRGTNAENAELLYSDLTYKIRGVLFEVRKKLGLGHKEQVYQNALEIEFKRANIDFESKKNISLIYEGKSIGVYQPDFILEDKILLELKALPEIGRPQIEQAWAYLKGCEYKLALLVNFGSKDLEIKRIVYDIARDSSAVSASSLRVSAGVCDQVENDEYILNLIDTPGHADFSYEVSRALVAVEGAILLVDATQGVQAQTLANLHLAQKEELVIIPAINKIDLPSADIKKTEEELSELLSVRQEDIFKVSAKTGEGVEELLRAVVKKVPAPKVGTSEQVLRALIFDSSYDPYQGVVAHVRIFEGSLAQKEKLFFLASGAGGEAQEVGFFLPERTAKKELTAGEIGYVATGIKEPEKVRVGDTITKSEARSTKSEIKIKALAGYKEPMPVVFASIFPENQDDYEILRESLKKLKLNDASLMFEPEEAGILGRGMRCGFLGMLHVEIVSERLKREYNQRLIFSNPSVKFKIKKRNAEETFIYSAARFPSTHEIEFIEEPWARVEVLTPAKFLGPLTAIVVERGGKITETASLGKDRLLIRFDASLREIIVDFYDDLKSKTQGFASLSYEIVDYRKSDLAKIDVLVSGEKVPAFAEIVPRGKINLVARERVQKLKELLPRELFAIALQAEVEGRIIARETIPAFRKDVTGYLYGGDRTRKMKLWKKQQKGKKKLMERAHVDIPPEVFLKMIKSR